MKPWITAGLFLLGSTLVFAGGDRCNASTQECLDGMMAKFANKGWLGVEINKNEQNEKVVKKVITGSPAEKAGFQTGDILVALNGMKLSEKSDALEKLYADMKPGSVFTYTLANAGRERRVTVTLAAIPEDIKAQWVGHHLLAQHQQSAIN